MADQPSPTESEAQIERRIDEVISQAAELAKDLKDEIGDPEPSGTQRDQRFFESEATSEGAPEMQLAQADAAIAHAAREIGSQPPPPKATKITLPPKGTKPAGRPQADAASSPVGGSARSHEAPPADSSADAIATESTPGVSEASAGVGDLRDGSAPPPISPHASSQSHASPLLERFVSLLEAIDRPFVGINADIRWVLGWVALVFLVGAASLFFFVIL